MKITKSQLKRIIKEEFEAIKEGGTGAQIEDLMWELESIMEQHPGTTIDALRGVLNLITPHVTAADLLAVLEDLDLQLREDKEPNRSAKGNVTQAAREKYATVGDDGFPIFDRQSAEAAIDLRGHASEADQKKIINKAAKYAPAAAKKAREVEKK